MDEKNTYSYTTRADKQLPIDSSMNEICKRKKWTPSRFNDAVNALADKNPSLYEKLKGVPEKNSLKRERRSPIPCYYEIEDLLCAMIEVRKAHRGIYGEPMEGEMFETLAEQLKEKLSSTEEPTYSQTIQLNNETIRNAMIRQCYKAVDSRLAIIRSLIEDKRLEVTPEHIYTICKSLDSLAIYIIHDATKKDRSQTSAGIAAHSQGSEHIEYLYDELMGIRKQCLDTNIPPKMEFSLPCDPDHNNEEIIQLLERYLSKDKKELFTQDNLCSLGKAYDKFLLLKLPKEDVKSARRFAKDFCKIRDYVAPRKEDTSILKNRLRKELIEFVQNVFDDLRKLDFIRFPSSNYTSMTINDRFFSDRLKYAHDHMYAEFYNALKLLRIFGTIKLYWHKSTAQEYFFELVEQNSFCNLIKETESELQEILTEYPNIPLTLPIKGDSLEAFFDVYKTVAVQYFPDEECIFPPSYSFPNLVNNLESGRHEKDPYIYGLDIAMLLYWSCQIAMIVSIDNYVSLLIGDMNVFDEFKKTQC